MEALYQCTIFVSLTLLAILIAIFVFAVSMYKAASEFSAKQEEATLNTRKELLNGRRKEISEKLKGVDDDAFMKELRKELDALKAELNSIDQSILKSRDKAKALTLRNMVSIPAAFLLMAIIVSGIATATTGISQLAMGITSWVLIVVSLYFTYKNLSTVDFFSRVIDLSVLVEQALERHAEKRRPIVDFDIIEYQLIIKHGDTQEIKPSLFLKQGLTAKNVEIRFLATTELKFPEEKLKKFDIPKENMRDPRYFYRKVSIINYGVYLDIPLKVQTPKKPGKYMMSYWITCEEYTGEETFFAIKVV